MRVSHSERFENVFSRELTQRFTGHFLNDERHEEIARVAVTMLFSGREVEVPLLRHDAQAVGVSHHVLSAFAVAFQQSDDIAQTARVVEQMTNQNRPTKIGNFWNELSNVIVERELALLLQQQDA